MKGQTQQAAFVTWHATNDAAGDIEEYRAGGAEEIGDDSHSSALFSDEEPVGLARWRDDGDRIGERQGPKRIRRGIAEHRRRWWHSQGGIRYSLHKAGRLGEQITGQKYGSP